MDNSLPKSSRYSSRNFRKIVDAFLGGVGILELVCFESQGVTC